MWMKIAIEKCAMLIIRGKRQMTEGIKLPNQEKKNRISGEKEIHKYLGISNKWR